MHDSQAPADRRQAPRYTLPAAYTPVRVRLLDGADEDLEGHAYNISATGLRFEIDEPLPAGSRIALRLELPARGGLKPGGPASAASPASLIEATPSPAVYAIATVVWLLDDADEPGPVRMGARFEGFPRSADQRRLRDLLADGRYAAAA